MRAKELDVHRTVLIGDSDYQSIVIALDIEDHPVVADDARAAILILDVLGTGPVRRPGFCVPRLQRLFGILVRRVGPKGFERRSGDDIHDSLLTQLRRLGVDCSPKMGLRQGGWCSSRTPGVVPRSRHSWEQRGNKKHALE